MSGAERRVLPQSRMRVKFVLLSLLVPLLCSALRIGAQQPLVGTIQGRIRDRSGAPVAEAALRATNLDTGSVHEGASDARGFYQLIELAPGRYMILARKNGFRDATVPQVTLHAGQTVSLPELQMVPGSPKKGDGTVIPRTSP